MTLFFSVSFTVGDEGLEPAVATDCSGKDLGESANQSATEFGAVGSDLPPIGTELARVLKAWPTLPETIRAAILELIRM